MSAKRKKNKPQFPLIFLGLFLVAIAFVFSLKSLAAPLPQDIQAARQDLTQDEFIEELAPYAQELQKGYGILPSIIIGQAILESDWGKSSLASEYNNLFGIKSFGHSKKVTLDTQEFYNGEWVTIQGDFRVYDTWEESMDDHTMLFVNGVDWNPALYVNVLTANDYRSAAQALQDAGYATDPDYASKIIQVIETYQLNRFDQ
ncbi:glycoside hydrolase family 73 protein [Enterococcus casseliflavus]|uniref:glycoside hydrolase family 73 protein n=1 Tax=Enterococcus casseliflavus TaxID=37734 RepID=UPI001BCD2D50|nr:glycoside hydrolase family 73 protein [Enterococcus casseliflavus]